MSAIDPDLGKCTEMLERRDESDFVSIKIVENIDLIREFADKKATKVEFY